MKGFFNGKVEITKNDGEKVSIKGDEFVLVHGGDESSDEYGSYNTPEVWKGDVEVDDRTIEVKVIVVDGKAGKPTLNDNGNEANVKSVKSTLKRKPDPKDGGFDD